MVDSLNRQKWKMAVVHPMLVNTSSIIHENRKLLFSEPKHWGKTKPLTTISCFVQNPKFQTSAVQSSIAKGLPDTWRIPKWPFTFHLNYKHILLEVIFKNSENCLFSKWEGTLCPPVALGVKLTFLKTISCDLWNDPNNNLLHSWSKEFYIL